MIKRYKRIVLAAFVLLLPFFCGCGAKEPTPKYTDAQLAKFPQPTREGLPQPTGGLVLAVSGQTLPAEEIILVGVAGSEQMAKQSSYENFAQAVYPYVHQMVIDRVTNMLLYQKAKSTIPESVFEEDGPLDKAVDSEIRKFLATYNNNYALAQREIERQGYDWRSFREYQKKQLLAQMYFGNNIDVDTDVRQAEMLEFYNANKEESFKQKPNTEFLLIHVREAKDGLSPQEIALAAIEDLKKGKDFAECVELYSQGIKANTGGLWQTAEPASLITPYDKVVEAIEGMRVGEVSGIIEAGEHLFIVKLLENTKAGYIPLSQVQKDIKQAIVSGRRREKVDNLLAELFEQADIKGLDGFMQYCLQQIYIRGRAN